MTNTLSVYGHRGFAGLWPENTLIGYQEALKLGVDAIDVDIALTKDNIVVASHDPFLNKNFTRYSNGQWLENNKNIIDLNFSDLRNYDVGAINSASIYSLIFPLQNKLNNITIPSLEEIIILLKENSNNNLPINLQIEIKTNPKRDNLEYAQHFVKIIIDTLKQHDFLTYAELQSFDWRALLYAQKLSSIVKTSYITEQNIKFDTFRNTLWTAGYELRNYDNSVPKMIASLGGSIWCPDYRDLSEELVAQAHAYNLKVVPWTADLEADMHELINFGVDGIITNRPDLLRKVMAARNMKLPLPLEIKPL